MTNLVRSVRSKIVTNRVQATNKAQMFLLTHKKNEFGRGATCFGFPGDGKGSMRPIEIKEYSNAGMKARF